MPSHAAYTADDVDDARRGHPAVDLASYANARGLEPLGSALVGHFGGLNPLWPEYVFNVLRGELVPGRFGTVQHELDEVELRDDGDPRQGGTYYGRRSNAKPGLRNLIGLKKEPPNEPFAAQAMWLPATGVKLLVPEAAVLPRLMLKTKEHMPWSERSLEPWAPSFGMAANQWVSAELRDAVARAVGPVLEDLGTAFARLELKNGALGLRVDGYRADDTDLDRLIAATATMADALAELARPGWAPAPFDQPLGGFDVDTLPPGYRTFQTDVYQTAFEELQQAATSMNLANEDPVALHRTQPHLRLPGTSMGVLAGTLPGGGFGRFTWQTQSHPGSSAYLRPAAVVAAEPDAPRTPIGGTLVKSTDMYVVVADGLACCWTRTNSVGTLDAADLVPRVEATFREIGASR
jgi:hypothetical protein